MSSCGYMYVLCLRISISLCHLLQVAPVLQSAVQKTDFLLTPLTSQHCNIQDLTGLLYSHLRKHLGIKI